MAQEVISIDCDLRRLHAWSSTDGPIASNASLPELQAILQSRDAGLFLFECASPHLYGQQVFKKKLSWMIYNSFCMATLTEQIPGLLVAPSSKWTHGYAEEVRHLIAYVKTSEGYTKAQNHDLKECQAMQYYHSQYPGDWVLAADYLETL